MQKLVTAKLDFSEDALTVSNAGATWQDVGDVNLLEIVWKKGIQKEGDDPEPGACTIRLFDKARNFEPDHSASIYFPNVVPGRRFRWRVQNGIDAGTIYSEGIWHATRYQPDWPGGVTAQEAIITCSDGFSAMALDSLPLLNPPDADTYEDVVEFDEPWGYWRLGEVEGTRARPRVSVTRRTVKRGKKKIRRKFKRFHGTIYSTREETGSVSGPSGVYKGNPILGEPGAILGDVDTSVKFTAAQNEYVKLVLGDTDETVRSNRLTLAAWVAPTGGYGTIMGVLGGPETTGGDSVWRLQISTAGKIQMFTQASGVSNATGLTTLPLNQWSYIAGTWDGGGVNLYLNGELDGESVFTFADSIPTPNLSNFHIGRILQASTYRYMNGWIDEPAIFEHVLAEERLMAHFIAGTARGYPQQTAGERIQAIVTSGLWSESLIQTTGREVQPDMQHGQNKLEEIGELAHAEGPRTMFFFDGGGDPVYLGHEWQATSSLYYTPQAVLGNAGGTEIPYESIEMVSDDEIFNEVTVSHESGESVTLSTGEVPRRENTEWTDVLLMEHIEVESLASHILDFYRYAEFRPASVTLNGMHSGARVHMLERKIGDCIQIKVRPRGTGAIIDRVANIIGWEKRLAPETGEFTCTWYLSRGFNAAPAAGGWHAGVAGFSEAGVTTEAA